MIRVGSYYAGIVLILSVILSGCSAGSNGTVAVLATNLPQMVSYAEYFNSVSERQKIAVSYVEKPWLYKQGKESPDLVAGTGLSSVTAIRSFADVGDIVESTGAEHFYKDFLDLGLWEEKQLLLPVSFSLPMIIITTGDAENISSPSILDIDELRHLSSEFSDADRMGFSPRWNARSSYLFARFFGVNFHQTNLAVPAWNESRLNETVRYINKWSVDLDGGIENEEVFRRKYLYGQEYSLVADKRIRFALSDIETYLHLPAGTGERIDFRWVSRDDRIPVDEELVMIGRPRTAKHRKPANTFLTWLFQPATQQKLLEVDQYRRVRGFGLAGGFSALKSVNEDALVRIYPFLLGRIPREENLAFPARLPSNWKQIRKEVIQPWLVEQSRQSVAEELLSDRLRAWQQEHPDMLLFH